MNAQASCLEQGDLFDDRDGRLVEGPGMALHFSQAIKNPHDLSIFAWADIGLAGVLSKSIKGFGGLAKYPSTIFTRLLAFWRGRVPI